MKKYILGALVSTFLSTPVFAVWFDDLQADITRKNYVRAIQRCEQKMSEHSGKEQDDFAQVLAYLSLYAESAASLDESTDHLHRDFQAVLGRIKAYTTGQAVEGEDDLPAARAVFPGVGAMAAADVQLDTLSAQFARNPRLQGIARALNPMIAHVDECLNEGIDLQMEDAFVTDRLSMLLAIGDDLKAGNPDLSFRKLRQDIPEFYAMAHSRTGYTIFYGEGDGRTAVTPEMFQGYVANFLDEHFEYQPKGVHILTSRVWTLAHKLFLETNDFRDFEDVFGAIVNNTIDTSSITGRVNQLFRLYILMLEDIGKFTEIQE